MEQTDAKGYPVRFSLVVWSYSETRGIGGEELHYSNVCLNDVKSKAEPTIKEEFRRHKPVIVTDATPKNPNHWDNGTRNIRLENGQIRKIHIRFIKSFNQMQIIY